MTTITVEQAEEQLAEVEARIARTASRFDAVLQAHGVRDAVHYVTRRTDKELHTLYAEARAWWRVIAGLKKGV